MPFFKLSYKKILFKTVVLTSLLELLVWKIGYFWWWLVLSLFLLLHFTRITIPLEDNFYQDSYPQGKLKKWFKKWRKDVWLFWKNKHYVFFVTPLFLYSGIVAAILFQGSLAVIQSLMFIFALFYLLYLKSLNEYFQPGLLREEEKEESLQKKYFLENIFSAINLFSLFLLYAVLFSLYPLFGVKLVWVSLLIITTTFLSNFQLFFIYGFSRSQIYIYNILIILIVAEIFWSLSFLPINFYSQGLFLVSIYYFLVGTLYFLGKKELDKAKIFRHFLITLAVIAIGLLTASWS